MSETWGGYLIHPNIHRESCCFGWFRVSSKGMNLLRWKMLKLTTTVTFRKIWEKTFRFWGVKNLTCFFCIQGRYGCFLKWWYPTTMGFPTKNDHFGVFWGYHHLRKHPIWIDLKGGSSPSLWIFRRLKKNNWAQKLFRGFFRPRKAIATLKRYVKTDWGEIKNHYG